MLQPLMTEFFLFAPFRKELHRRRFLYMGNKNKGNENKIIRGDFNCTMDKMGRLVETKHRDFKILFPIMSCQN